MSYPRPPCGVACSDRQVGCHAVCPKWAEYTQKRDASYAERAAACQTADAIAERIRRCAKFSAAKRR